MANPYAYNVVTFAGAALIAQATYDLYLDQACTSPFVYDSSSLYLLGYLSSGTWKKSSVQTVADMPSSTTSDISSSISAQVLTSSGKLWLITNYTGTLHDGGYQWSKVCKVCSSNLVTVVTVYNSSNVAYNAFKFTASGTDYYYVLDGTQTDWTDDLSSIGYSLTKTPAVGDVITLGNYPQSTNTLEPIEWIVLDVDTINRKCFVISKYILDACKYVMYGYSTTTWEGSRARDWLNSTFYNGAFDSAEKAKIITSSVTTPANTTYGTSGGNPTQDNLFFLSEQEASSCFASDADRKTTATATARNNGVWTTADYYGVWLTRTPGQSQNYAVNVSHEGLVWVQGDAVDSTWTGARPAFWMSY